MSNPKKSSLKYLILLWSCGLLSCVVLVLTATAFYRDMQSFRSCNINSTDLTISTCGKSSINFSDGLIFVMLVLSLLLVLSIFTHAYRKTKKVA